MTGCTPAPAGPEYEEHGQFRVTGLLQSTSCGAGHPSPAELNFYVALSSIPDSNVGFWKIPGGWLVQGVLTNSADAMSFRFQSNTQNLVIEPVEELGIIGCAITNVETIEATLTSASFDAGPSDGAITDGGLSDAASRDAGAVDAAAPDGGSAPLNGQLIGATTVQIAPVPGGNCAALLVLGGGPFSSLPCEIEYTLTGEILAEPLF